MTIEFRCTACNQMLRVSDGAVGKQARCPQCKAQMAVPLRGDPGQSPQVVLPDLAPAADTSSPPAISSDLAQQLEFLRQGMTPRPTSAEPVPSNPFGDGSAATSPSDRFIPGAARELNPYASPAAAGQLYAPPFGLAGSSQGLPWEAKGQNPSTWIETTKSIITEPVSAFHDMWPEGGHAAAFSFWAVGTFIAVVGAMIWETLGELVPVWNKQGVDVAEIALVGVLGLAVLGGYALLMLFVQSVTLHLLLRLVGGANRGFGTTFRVVAYVNGATSWLYMVPCLGGCILLILQLVTTANGLASAHRTSNGKAAAAVIIQLALVLLVALGIATLAAGIGEVWLD